MGAFGTPKLRSLGGQGINPLPDERASPIPCATHPPPPVWIHHSSVALQGKPRWGGGTHHSPVALQGVPPYVRGPLQLPVWALQLPAWVPATSGVAEAYAEASHPKLDRYP